MCVRINGISGTLYCPKRKEFFGRFLFFHWYNLLHFPHKNQFLPLASMGLMTENVSMVLKCLPEAASVLKASLTSSRREATTAVRGPRSARNTGPYLALIPRRARAGSLPSRGEWPTSGRLRRKDGPEKAFSLINIALFKNVENYGEERAFFFAI